MSLLQLVRQPLAMTKAGLDQLVALTHRERSIDLEALRAADGLPLEGTETVEIRNGVAIIPSSGILQRADAWYLKYLGISSYERIRRDFQVAITNPNVRAILFDVDSPGGEVQGADELSLAIFKARGIKPIWSYASGTDASAAWWISSACDRIIGTPTAMVGSIGVRCTLIDWSKYEEKLGIQVYEVLSDQSPLKDLDASDASDRQRMKATLTAMCRVFITTAARNRGVDEETVLKDFGRGDVLIGQAAVDAGLIDALGDFESVLAELGASGKTTSQRSFAMGAQRNGGHGQPTANMEDEECDGCGRAMGESDSVYCSACYGDAEEARVAVGVDAKASQKQLVERAKALAGLERDMFAITGATTIAAAIGIVRAGVESSAEVAQLRATAEKQRDEAMQIEFRASLKDPRLTLGHLARVVPTFLSSAPGKEGAKSERDKAADAIGGLKDQTAEQLLAVFAAVKATPDTLATLKAFTEALGPAPTIVAEPANTPENHAKVAANRPAGSKLDPSIATAMGVTDEDVAKYANVKSEKDLKPTKKEAR